MTLPIGKGIFIWVYPACGYGTDPNVIADALALGGFSHITFKGLQSQYEYIPNQPYLPDLVAALKDRGISPRIYQYITGGSITNAQDEAAAAVDYCLELGVDGLDIDAEAEYNQAATQAQAKLWAVAYMNGLIALPPSFSVSLCSYRYPSVQSYFPWSQFLGHPRIDYVAPQVYWQGAVLPAAAGWQLAASKAEYGALAPHLPYIPVGSAYCEHDWCSSPAQVKNFSDTAKALNLQGISFWSLQHLPEIAGMKDTVFSLDWTGSAPPPDPDPCPPGLVLRVVTTGALNVRTGPGTGFPVVGTLPPGALVNVSTIDTVSASSVWAQHESGWSAVVHGGTRYMDGVL